MSRFLVTGGCGFIGSHLVEALLAAGHAVRVLDDLSTGRRDNLPEAAEVVVGCVTDPAAVSSAIATVDGVFHLAAIASVARSNEEWLWTHRVNQGGTVAVLDAARAAGAPVVLASSAAIYGDQTVLPLGETACPAPLTAYGVDKLGSELHGRVAASIHGLPTVALRFFNVYGPRQDPRSPYSGVISIFAQRLLSGQPLTLHGDGSQTRDFVYVADVVQALLAAMRHCRNAPAPGRRFAAANVCTGRPTSIATLADRLMAVAGRSVPVERIDPRAGDIAASVGDPSAATALLGFRAATSLDEGLAALLAALAREAGR
jgi:UDP-glucose 4-epimerase